MATKSRLSWKQRIGQWGVGYTANFLMTKVFNLGVYPLVLWYFGLWWGAVIMWPLSSAVCYSTILFYDWCKVDWLGIETLKEVREAETGKGFFYGLLRWVLRRGDVLTLVVLSINWDPFICVVQMRQGAYQYNGMTRRDWRIFWISSVVSDVWWISVVFSGLTVGEWVLHTVQSAF